MADNIFALVPVEVLADRRLTQEQMRVLIALLSFRAKNTDLVWPGRDALGERAGGMHPANVSKATSALVKLGWLEKDGNGGRSQSCCYRIIVPNLENLSIDEPETVADSATSPIETVADSARVSEKTVADSATHPPETVAESATKTVADSARGKEQTSEHTNKSNRQGARGLLSQRGVSGQLADAWIKVRLAKRLAITELGLDAIQREAEKAGLTFVQAITICCEEGWGGFKAHWERGGKDSQSKGGAPPWWSNESGILAKGCEVKLLPRPGESMSNFKARINERLSQPA